MDYKNAKLLLVDDNPVNVELLGEILEQQGCKVFLALNGFLALDIARNEKPDLIVLDIAMPAMDGFQVFQFLKFNPETADIPVIFVTSLNETEDIERAKNLGCKDYITKPFDIESTAIRILSHLKP